MALITFMSDFGTVDHYVAAVKAAIVSEAPSQPITDISHDIRPFDIAHAANVLLSVYKEFPEGSVHLVAVDSMKEKSEGIAVSLDGHLFVGFDCGLLSIISEKKPDAIVRIASGSSTFPAKDILAKAALKLASGSSIEEVGTEAETIEVLFNRQLKVTKREIVGHVVTVDHYGNLISNIERSAFEKMLEMNGANTRFGVRFGREEFQVLHQYFSDVESGDCFVLFNSNDQLQVGINKGNASELLGLGVDSPVLITFSNG